VINPGNRPQARARAMPWRLIRRRATPLLPIAAVHRSGLLVLADGTRVRVLEVLPGHRPAELHRLFADLPAGSSLQLRTEVFPVEPHLDPPEDPLAVAVAASLRNDPALIAQARLACHVVIPSRGRRGTDGNVASLAFAEMVRSHLERLGLHPRLLDGSAVVRLVRRAMGSRHVTAGSHDGLEVLGELEPRAEAKLARSVASELRSCDEAIVLDFSPEHRFADAHGQHQVIAFGGRYENAVPGWPVGALRIDLPEVVSVHVHRPPTGEPTADVSVYCHIGAAPGDHAVATLNARVDEVAQQMAASFGVRTDRGQFRQRALWLSAMPLGIDAARRTETLSLEAAGRSAPFADSTAGGSGGVPLAASRSTGVLESIRGAGPRAPLVALCGGGLDDRRLWRLVLVTRCLASGRAVAVVGSGSEYERIADVVPTVPGAKPTGAARLYLLDTAHPFPEGPAQLVRRAVDWLAPREEPALVIGEDALELAEPGGSESLLHAVACARRAGALTVVASQSPNPFVEQATHVLEVRDRPEQAGWHDRARGEAELRLWLSDEELRLVGGVRA
jgi:hypothetical protein